MPPQHLFIVLPTVAVDLSGGGAGDLREETRACGSCLQSVSSGLGTPGGLGPSRTRLAQCAPIAAVTHRHADRVRERARSVGPEASSRSSNEATEVGARSTTCHGVSSRKPATAVRSGPVLPAWSSIACQAASISAPFFATTSSSSSSRRPGTTSRQKILASSRRRQPANPGAARADARGPRRDPRRSCRGASRSDSRHRGRRGSRHRRPPRAPAECGRSRGRPSSRRRACRAPRRPDGRRSPAPRPRSTGPTTSQASRRPACPPRTRRRCGRACRRPVRRPSRRRGKAPVRGSSSTARRSNAAISMAVGSFAHGRIVTPRRGVELGIDVPPLPTQHHQRHPGKVGHGPAGVLDPPPPRRVCLPAPRVRGGPSRRRAAALGRPLGT
jgi:hypothetical protein